jgi:hypothetical protein
MIYESDLYVIEFLYKRIELSYHSEDINGIQYRDSVEEHSTAGICRRLTVNSRAA